jgi:hypothetical protein
LLGRSSIGRGDLSEEIAAGARRLIREIEFSPPRFLSASTRTGTPTSSFANSLPGQCVLLVRRCRPCCRTDVETIITVGVPAQPAVVFLRHATIVGFLSRSVTNA